MSIHKRRNDIYWVREGDISFDTNTGDLRETKNVLYRSLIQQIATRLESSKGDWSLHREIGVGFEQFLGKLNNRENGQLITDAIRLELLRSGLLATQELNVEVIPVSPNEIYIYIRVIPAGSRQSITLSYSYNYSDNKLTGRYN